MEGETIDLCDDETPPAPASGVSETGFFSPSPRLNRREPACYICVM